MPVYIPSNRMVYPSDDPRTWYAKDTTPDEAAWIMYKQRYRARKLQLRQKALRAAGVRTRPGLVFPPKIHKKPRTTRYVMPELVEKHYGEGKRERVKYVPNTYHKGIDSRFVDFMGRPSVMWNRDKVYERMELEKEAPSFYGKTRYVRAVYK